MPQILSFSRNRCTSVEPIDETAMRASCRLQDTFTEAFVEIRVKLPDLEIAQVKWEVVRSSGSAALEPDCLEKIVGTRIGAGMLKIIKGLIGGEAPIERQLAFMVEECCHGVILSFTKDVLMKSPKDEAGTKEYYAKMVRDNIRLYNRCAAFAAGSSIVEGIEPPDPNA